MSLRFEARNESRLIPTACAFTFIACGSAFKGVHEGRPLAAPDSLCICVFKSGAARSAAPRRNPTLPALRHRYFERLDQLFAPAASDRASSPTQTQTL